MAKKKSKPKKSREEELFEKLSTEMKRQWKASTPDSFAPLNGEVRIMIPAPFTTMEFKSDNFNAIHLDVIREMFYCIREVLIKQLDPDYRDINSLFKASDFSKNGKDLFIPMKLKDFHVHPKRYPELRSALRFLSHIPCEIPFEDSERRKYRKCSNFCDVYIPEEGEAKIRNYVNITIEEEVAKRLVTMDFGYGEVGRIASQNLSSKYSKRMYNLLCAHKNNGGYTQSIFEFRKTFGINSKYKEQWSKIEENVLLSAKKEMDFHFSKGEVDLSFTYRPIYNGERHTGVPDAIEYKIFSVVSDMDRKLIVIEKGYTEQFEKMLKEELGVSDSICRMIMKRVNGDNVKAAISKAIDIKLQVDSGKVQHTKNYVIGAFNKFFEEYVPPKPEENTLSPQARWNKIQEEIGRGHPKSISDIFSQLLLDSYNENEKKLYITAPSEDYARNNITKEISELLENKLNKHFGKDVSIQFIYKD